MTKTSIHFEHYRGNEEFVKRVYDQIDQCERRKQIIVTPFFSPDQRVIIERICGSQHAYVIDGGYEGAERVRCAFLPYVDDVANVPSVVMQASYSSSFQTITHRDVLGALMHLGIERDRTGDIIIDDQEIYLIIDEDIENYITCNLTKIKRTSVHFSRTNKIVTYTPQIRRIQRIVSSLRLDVIVASLASVSRTKASTLIVSGRVKVNHVVLEQSSYMCNNNSAISIRGYGRYHFAEVMKKTKKDHYVIDVGVYE